MGAEDVFQNYSQAIPGDQTKKQLGLRTLSKPITPTVLKAGKSQDLALGDLEFETDFDGPWQVNIIGVKFMKMVDGQEVPNGDPKNVTISLVLGDEEFELVHRTNYRGVSVTLTDKMPLGSGDQVKVWVSGQGVAKTQIRGEQL